MSEENKDPQTILDDDASQPKVIIKEKWNADWVPLFRIGSTVFLTFVCCILFFFLIFRYQGFASVGGKLLKAGQSILIGLLLAYLLNPVMKGIERFVFPYVNKWYKDEEKARKKSRIIGITGSLIFLLILIAALIMMIVPSIMNSIVSLVNNLPKYVDSTMDVLQNRFENNMFTDMAEDYINEAVDYLEDWATKTLLPQMQTYITTITSGVISVLKGVLNFIIGIIVMVYVMAIQGTLSGQAKKVIYASFSPRVGNLIVDFIRKSNEVFGGFITGKLIDSAIIGVIAYIGCSLMKTPDTMLVSVIIGVTNIIPFFGPFIGAVPSVFLVLIQNPWKALYLVIFIVVLQQVDGNIIGPKILGNSTGLSSFWVMVAILVGGGMFGFLGMLFGVPVFAMIYYIVRRIVNHQIVKKHLPRDARKFTQLDHVDEKSGRAVYKESQNP